MRRLRDLRLSAALAVLAALGFVVAAEALEHTDDGCGVEIHCLPCLWHHGATVVLAAVPQPAAPVALGSARIETPAGSRLTGACFETPSRAPPLA
jgi:hypothetical protein